MPRIEIGEVNTVETLGLFPAGKGINVAKVLKDLSVEVAVGGFLGEDNVGDFETLFKKQGLEDKFHRVAGKTRINVKNYGNRSGCNRLKFLRLSNHSRSLAAIYSRFISVLPKL